jgi:hypothetical protein
MNLVYRLAACAMLALAAMAARADVLVINRAYAQLLAAGGGHHLVIDGEALSAGPPPSVVLGGQALTVLNWSATQVTARLPFEIAPGTHRLVVSAGNAPHQSAVFAVDVGATNFGRIGGQVTVCGNPAARSTAQIRAHPVALTDENGGFGFHYVPAGQHELVVEVPGYAPVSVPVNVVHGRVTLVSVPIC